MAFGIGNILSGMADVVTGGYASTALRIAGTGLSMYESYQSNKNLNDMIEQSQSQASSQYQSTTENQALIKQLALKNLSVIEQMSDPESWGRTAGIYRAILQGQEPMELEPFRSQFEEIEYATQAKLRDIEAQAEDARRVLASNVPMGGLKMRMLVDVAMKAQDAKAAVTNEARNAIRQKNMDLKNEYMGKALDFGKVQPSNISTGLQTSSGMLQGYPTASGTYASPSEAMRLQMYQSQGAGSNLSSIGESIGKLSTKPTTETTTTPVIKTSAETYVPNDYDYKDYYKGGV